MMPTSAGNVAILTGAASSPGLGIACRRVDAEASVAGSAVSDFSTVAALNTSVVMLHIREVERRKASHGDSSMINAVAIGGLPAGRGIMPSRAFEAALNHFSRSMAAELAPLCISVNCLAPARAKMRKDRYLLTLPPAGIAEDIAEAALNFAACISAGGVVLPVDVVGLARETA